MPQPTIPTTMRSDGAGWSSLPRALAGMMVGAATAAAVAAINRRREILAADGEVFIANNSGGSAIRARAENSCLGQWAGRIQDWSADSHVRAFLASDQVRADK